MFSPNKLGVDNGGSVNCIFEERYECDKWNGVSCSFGINYITKVMIACICTR